MRSYPEQEPGADVALHPAAVGQTDGQIRSGDRIYTETTFPADRPVAC